MPKEQMTWSKRARAVVVAEQSSVSIRTAKHENVQTQTRIYLSLACPSGPAKSITQFFKGSEMESSGLTSLQQS